MPSVTPAAAPATALAAGRSARARQISKSLNKNEGTVRSPNQADAVRGCTAKRSLGELWRLKLMTTIRIKSARYEITIEVKMPTWLIIVIVTAL